MSKFCDFSNSNYENIISNAKIDYKNIDFAQKVIKELYADVIVNSKNGFGSFGAAIYDDKNNLISKSFNSVVNDKCSNNHAEVNAIHIAETKLGTYDLSPFNLNIYVTAEPCMMCLGAILWSGIKNVYYGVPSDFVEQITGYDEGFKPDWFNEFANRGINVYGNIEAELGCEILKKYVEGGFLIYKPQR